MLLKKIKAFLNRGIEYLIFSRNFITSEETVLSPHSMYRGVRIYGDVEIAEGCKIINGVSLKTSSQIKINRYTSINGPNTDLLANINKIHVGSFCSIARNVSIQEYNHKYKTLTTYPILQNIFGQPKKDDIYSTGDIIIGNDVWIGTQCVILSGSTIGHGAIVAANTVVNSHVPPYAIVAGSPSKVIKYRFSEEIIEKLIAMEWWDWPLEKIKLNQHLFMGELTMEKLLNVKD